MKDRKQLVLVFGDVEQIHLGKDVFLVPYYLGRKENMEVSIVFPKTDTNQNLPRTSRGVRLISLNRKNLFLIKSFLWLIFNAFHIDVFMLFHFNRLSMVLANLYKFLNPKGKLYVKSDGYFCFSDGIKEDTYSGIKRRLYKKYLSNIDCVSFETNEGYCKALTQTLFGVSLKSKAVFMPNGFDEEYLRSLHIKELNYSQKENVIITVGRIGANQKNTEMFLRALEKISLFDWKVYIIGPIELRFQSVIDSFYASNPEKQDSVIFVGNVSDKKKLWEYFIKAKVFVLTSRWETFGLVLGEARRFKNFIVSTDVGCIRDLINDSKDGIIINLNDINGLTQSLKGIIEGSIDISEVSVGNCSWKNMVERIKL